ncbi:MAG: hypothetical protein Q7T57_07260 [Dehalococcoidales bacterium]|nr:hypothetical protein [Dehalococcoidales bacterium]
MHLDDVTKKLHDSESVRIACVNAETRAIEYHSIVAEDLTIQLGEHDVVDMVSDPQGVSLTATRGHDMYVQMDGERNFTKRTAGELMSKRGDSRKLRMLDSAAGGRAAEKLPELDIAKQQLGLQTESHVQSFLELLGCYFADGKLNHHQQSIVLSSHAESLLARLPMVDSYQTAEGIVITSPDWFAYFAAQSSLALSSIWSWSLRLDHSRARAIIRGLEHSQQHVGTIGAASIVLRDQLVQLLLHAGFSATFSAAKDGWCVHYSTSANSGSMLQPSKDFSARKIQGRVWCVTVPQQDQLIMVRRATVENGAVTAASRPIVAGNCKKSAVKVIDFGSACLTGSDSRVLTNRGFMFLEEIEALERAHELDDHEPEVLYASYDTKQQKLVYAPGHLVYPAKTPSHLVDFTQREYASQWSSNSGDFVTAKADASNHISLRVTPDHQMYVNIDGERIKATAAELQESSRNQATMVPTASAGIDLTHTEGPMSILDVDTASPVVQLDLRTAQQLHVFLQQYGCWLAGKPVEMFASYFKSLSSSRLADWTLTRLAKSQIRLVLDAARSNSNAISVTSVSLREDLVVACLHAGYSPSFTVGASESEWNVQWLDEHEQVVQPNVATTDVKSVEYSSSEHGRIWCVQVDHPDHLILAQRAYRNVEGIVTKASRPIIVGNCFANQKTYTYIQSRFYRAPEVLLGLSYNGAIDMWSLGCILVEMHTGKPLFDGQDEADQMVKQVEILGVPPRHMLEKNRKAEKFFELVDADVNQKGGQFRLKRKFAANLGSSIRLSLGHKWEDTQLYREFEDLISQMLLYDPLKRIRPSQALAHPFFAAVAGLIAGETAAAASSSAQAAAAAAGAKLQSPSGNPLGSGSGVAAALGASAGGDTHMASSPAGASAMDTTSSPAAVNQSSDAAQQQKFAMMQQQAQLHAHHHGHHAGRSGSRKRPHSNPVFGATSAPFTVHQGIQPLDAHINQTLLAQAQKQQKQQTTHAAAASSSAAPAQPQLNNLMDSSVDLKPETQAAPAAQPSNESNAQMEDSQPDSFSMSVSALPPVKHHGMVTRSSGKAADASHESSASSSGRSTPEPADASAARSRGSSLVVPDASTATTANASAASSPKAPTAGGSGSFAPGAVNLPTAGVTTAAATTAAASSSSSSSMVDIEPSGPTSSDQEVTPTKSGGKKRNKRGKKGGKTDAAAAAAASSNPNMSEGEGDGPQPSVGSNAMSRMSLDLDNSSAAVGHRTRSHANQ